MKPTKTNQPQYPQVRVTLQAREHLDALIPAIRKTSGLNTTMTDVVSEAILSIPMPEVKQAEPKRRARRAQVAETVSMPAA